MIGSPKVRLELVQRFERDFKLRLPFRFGAITLTEGHGALVTRGHHRAQKTAAPSLGVCRQSLGAKWFDKNPAFSDAQNLDQAASGSAYGDPSSTRGGVEYAVRPRRRDRQGPDRRVVRTSGVALSGRPPTAWALLDRGFLDALGRAIGQSFAQMISQHCRWASRRRAELMLILIGYDLGRFRPVGSGARPHRRAVYGSGPVASDHGRQIKRPRHLLRTGCRKRWRRSLDRTVRATTSLKVGGDVAADLDRLTRIAAVLGLPRRRPTTW